MKILVIALYDYSYAYSAYEIINGVKKEKKITTEIIDGMLATIYDLKDKNESIYADYIKNYDLVLICEDSGCEILKWKNSKE